MYVCMYINGWAVCTYIHTYIQYHIVVSTCTRIHSTIGDTSRQYYPYLPTYIVHTTRSPIFVQRTEASKKGQSFSGRAVPDSPRLLALCASLDIYPAELPRQEREPTKKKGHPTSRMPMFQRALSNSLHLFVPIPLPTSCLHWITHG